MILDKKISQEKKLNGLVRRIPYPYRAMMAICSDLDETADRNVYLEIAKFLNTSKETCMGPGVNLEVANTIYFDMPANNFSYWNTDDYGREMIRTLIQSGHIDCLHSYGDLAISRSHAARALDELSRHNCKLEVWIDHGLAPSNFGEDIMKGSGDVLGSPVYHADLTCAYGIKYVWRGRVTSVIGQDIPRSLKGVWNLEHPLSSSKTAAKEGLKGVLGRLRIKKYLLHGPNQIFQNSSLRDGHSVFEFIRSNPYWAGVEKGATADGIGEVLNKSMLDYLIDREGFCILYTHLGKTKNCNMPFSKETIQAFRLLSQYCNDGKILLTTTRRLLTYCRSIRNMNFSVRTDANRYIININYTDNEIDLSGLSFYVPGQKEIHILVNGKKVTNYNLNKTDHTNKYSTSFKWNPLKFPSII